jgi:hypothetical protein
MGISIPKDIFGFKGQRVNEIKLDQEAKQLIIRCSRAPYSGPRFQDKGLSCTLS